MSITKCTKIVANNIPKNCFQFLPFAKILSDGDQGLLFDVIGHVVQRSDMKETNKNGKKGRLLEGVLKDLEDNPIDYTLWGEFADQLNGYIYQHGTDSPVVIILQICKVNVFSGKNGISNAFYGTKLLINPGLNEDVQYKEKLQKENIFVSQVVSYVSGHDLVSLADELLYNTQRMTILDIIEAEESCFCSVLAKVVEIDIEKDWVYDGCTRCFKRVEPVGKKRCCPNCDIVVTAVPRYMVYLNVIDESGSTTFILFDRLVSKYFGVSAANLKLKQPKEYGEEEEVHYKDGDIEIPAEGGDSNIKLDESQQGEDNSLEFFSDGNEQTPAPKSSEKRQIDALDVCSSFDCDTQHSATQNPKKMKAIKKEPSN